MAYNDKKVWALYWSFLDFGPAALSNEDAWFTGLIARSCTIKNKVAGGMMQVFKAYIKSSSILQPAATSAKVSCWMLVLPHHRLYQPQQRLHQPKAGPSCSLTWCVSFKMQMHINRYLVGRVQVR